MKKLWLSAALFLAPAFAHHSAAGFDYTKTLSANGTLKQFRWASPHSSALVEVTGADGKPVDMSFISVTPSAYVHQGFKPGDFKLGQKVAISWHPSRTGGQVGVLATLKLQNGRIFKEGDSQATPYGQ